MKRTEAILWLVLCERRQRVEGEARGAATGPSVARPRHRPPSGPLAEGGDSMTTCSRAYLIYIIIIYNDIFTRADKRFVRGGVFRVLEKASPWEFSYDKQNKNLGGGRLTPLNPLDPPLIYYNVLTNGTCAWYNDNLLNLIIIYFGPIYIVVHFDCVHHLQFRCNEHKFLKVFGGEEI